MKIAYTLAALALTAGPVLADEITLSTPMAAETLHDGGIDMSVYWVEAGDAQEVVATYTTRVGDYAPARIKLRMQDGDSVAFGVPGARDVLYSFARRGDALQVSAQETGLQYAAN